MFDRSTVCDIQLDLEEEEDEEEEERFFGK